MKLFLLFFVFLVFGEIVNGQTTVLYNQQTTYYSTWSDGAGDFNPNSFQMGMWANTGGTSKQVVAWRQLKTDGVNAGSARSLQVGDEFRISVSAHTVYGEMGFALLSNPSTKSNWSDRLNNAAISVNLTNYGNWYAKYYDGTTINAATSTGTNNIGGSTSYKNFVFTCLLTAPNRMNITITDGLTTSYLYDLLLNNSNPITDYSTYLSDDWDGSSKNNIYWNTNSGAHADYIKNTKSISIGSSNSTFTIGGVIADGLDAGSTSTTSINSLTKTGTGVLTLNSSNTYTGTTTVNGGTLIMSSNQTINDLIINSAATLTVNPGKALTVANLTNNSGGTLNLLSDVNGTATILTSAITGSGTANVKQYLPTYSSWYMSSPMTGTLTIPVDNNSATPAILDWYDETKGDPAGWTAATGMKGGTGYFLNPGTTSGASTLTFTGTLNNGNIPVDLTRSSVTKAGFNLIGNPYPSFLDWTAVCGYTTDAGVTHPNQAIMPTTTMWYRTKVSGTWDFVTVNGAGVTSPSGNNVTNYIPPMQAFWVRATTGGGTLQLTNSMCSHAATSNPLKAPAAKNSEQLQMVRLQVNNGTNTNEAVIYSSTNAKNGFDMYDAPKMSNSDLTIPEIYTLLNNEQIVINAMNTFPLDQEISLGFVPGSATSFSIKANEVSNLPSGVKIILKDNITKAETDLTDGVSGYNFTSATSTDSRFSVIFRSAGTATGIVDNHENKNISIYRNANNQITIHCVGAVTADNSVLVYNAVGQKLFAKQLTGYTTVLNYSLNSGIYFVTVNVAGNKTTKKVIINE